MESLTSKTLGFSRSPMNCVLSPSLPGILQSLVPHTMHHLFSLTSEQVSTAASVLDLSPGVSNALSWSLVVTELPHYPQNSPTNLDLFILDSINFSPFGPSLSFIFAPR